MDASRLEQVRNLLLGLQQSLCTLCSTMVKNGIILKNSRTTLLYGGKAFLSFCDTGSVATILNASDFLPGTIPGYLHANCVTLCVQHVSGRNVFFLRLSPLTVKYRDRCARVTAYYLTNMPVCYFRLRRPE